MARPHFSDRAGKPLYTAGLAEYPDQAMAPVWQSVKVFDGVARQASALKRGRFVRLTGKQQEDRFRQRGVEVTKPVIPLVQIEADG